jgi:hypothetical protein
VADDPTLNDLTYDEALATVLALVGQRVEVHVLDAGENPHHVATFGGRLRAGYSTTGGEPTDTEAILLRFDAGDESAGLSIDRELFGGAIGRNDGSLTIQLGDVSFVIMPRE